MRCGGGSRVSAGRGCLRRIWKKGAGQGRIVMWNVRGQDERGLRGRLGR
jgi:hypothetical protein